MEIDQIWTNRCPKISNVYLMSLENSVIGLFVGCKSLLLETKNLVATRSSIVDIYYKEPFIQFVFFLLYFATKSWVFLVN